MSRLTFFAVSAALLVLLAPPVQAQSWEVSGLAGYTPSSALDRRAPVLNQLDISGGFTWGVQAARFFTPRWGAEALWTQQSSAQRIGTAAGSANLFTLTAGQLHGNVVYRFSGADARLQPFAFAGLGATSFWADDLPSETKFSLGFGGGVRYFFPVRSACGGTSVTNRRCSATPRPDVSAIRSDSARARCTRSNSPPAPSCVSDLRRLFGGTPMRHTPPLGDFQKVLGTKLAGQAIQIDRLS